MDTTRRYWWKRNNVREKLILILVLINEIFSFHRNYIIEKRDKTGGDWVRCNDPINGTQATISKLKEGHEYEFRVMAENMNGLSEPLITDKAVLVKNPFSKFFIFVYFF
jgi:hypothetical protein